MSEITYRGYSITRCDYGWEFTHPEYDGAPHEPGGPPADPRYGVEPSVEACRISIDWLEDDVLPERRARRDVVRALIDAAGREAV